MQMGWRMKYRSMSVSAFTVFSILILLTACSQQQAEWQGTIEEADGVTIVRNPIEPMYEGEVLALEEELTIGKENEKGEPVFIRIWAIQVDENGNIYVLDSKPPLIKIFSASGEFIREFGKEGQGPGEWQGPHSFEVLSIGNIVVCDYSNRRLSFFSNEGVWIKDISVADHSSSILRISVDSAGKLYALSSQVSRESNNQLIGKLLIEKFDLDFNYIKHIVAVENEILPRNVITPHGPRFYEIVTPNDYVVWAVSSKYELHIHNPEGQETRRIIKDYAPIKFTEHEKKRVENAQTRGNGYPEGYEVRFPTHYNPLFFHFIADDEGRLIVRTTERDNEDNYYNDIFDADGRFITKIAFKYRPLVWKKGRVYCGEVDEDGFQYIKRYKASWNY